MAQQVVNEIFKVDPDLLTQLSCSFVVVQCSLAKSCPTLCDPMDCSTPDSSVLHYLPEFAQINSYSLSGWCHQTLTSSAAHFSLYLQTLLASESFPMNQLFTSGGQNIGASVSTSILPMNTEGWFPLGLTGLISLQSKRLSRVLFSTTIQKHSFFVT